MDAHANSFPVISLMPGDHTVRVFGNGVTQLYTFRVFENGNIECHPHGPVPDDNIDPRLHYNGDVNPIGGGYEGDINVEANENNNTMDDISVGAYDQQQIDHADQPIAGPYVPGPAVLAPQLPDPVRGMDSPRRRVNYQPPDLSTTPGLESIHDVNDIAKLRLTPSVQGLAGLPDAVKNGTVIVFHRSHPAGPGDAVAPQAGYPFHQDKKWTLQELQFLDKHRGMSRTHIAKHYLIRHPKNGCDSKVTKINQNKITVSGFYI